MLQFEAPGPGSWDIDRSHYDSAITPLSNELMGDASEAAYGKLFKKLGVPAASVEMKEVNGFIYTRLVPFLGGDSTSTKVPPDWVIKLVFRLHPELRRREKLAAEMLKGDASRAVINDWHARIKPETVAKNLQLQHVDLQALDAPQLAHHVTSVIEHVRWTFEEHHRLHGYDLGPLAIFVGSCQDWGIEAVDSLAALAGASPSTNEPRRLLVQIRHEVEQAGVAPTTLDDVRASSPKAKELLDGYLDRHGSVVFSSYDIDSPTLGERPGLILSTIMHATAPPEAVDADASAAALRSKVPAAEHGEFDRLLADARDAMDMRDDNGPVTVEWPVGLLRVGLLEAGRRLADTGRIEAIDHIFSLERGEVSPLIVLGTGPTASELATRHEQRLAQRELDPPDTLGPPAADPPLDAMPPAIGRTLKMTLVAMEALGMAAGPAAASMTGTGIGDAAFEGTARVALTAEEALLDMEPGEILVTRATSPAFNLVLSLAGGLVTVAGGPMSHAAVLSRELGLPAVIGVADCLDHVANGDRIKIDPSAGTVEVIVGS